MNIHEVASPKEPRLKARFRVWVSVQTTKFLHALVIFAHPSLAFDPVTRRDLAHLEWSTVFPRTDKLWAYVLQAARNTL